MNGDPRHMAKVQRTIAAIIVVGFVVAIGVFVLVDGRGSSSPGGGSRSSPSSAASSGVPISNLAAAAAPSPGASASASSKPTPTATKLAAKSGVRSTQAPSASRCQPHTAGLDQTFTQNPRPTKTKATGSSSLPSKVRSSVSKAVSYFRTGQLTSGGFGASGQAATTTPWVVQAIAAAGGNASTFKRSGGKSPIAYLQSLDIAAEATGGSATSSNPADFYAKMIITCHAAGVSSL